ncbi:DUF4148 domain-containing protein [Candidatus Burkholderia verschuerenii]|nr:DUF4148 domain-containing protein [Candidatus Burkholderia verschuerenii]
MKTFLCGLLAAASLIPATVFAQQTNGPLTRADVRHELAQLESVGYRPSTHDGDYPQALMSAEAKVAAIDAHRIAYGGESAGTHASGAPASAAQ